MVFCKLTLVLCLISLTEGQGIRLSPTLCEKVVGQVYLGDQPFIGGHSGLSLRGRGAKFAPAAMAMWRSPEEALKQVGKGSGVVVANDFTAISGRMEVRYSSARRRMGGSHALPD
jgi:hypothetical protein